MSAEELKLADELFEAAKYQELFDLLDKLSNKETSEVQWRLARALYFIYKNTKSSSEKTKLIQQAFVHAEKSIALEASNFGANKWYGTVLSEKSSTDGTTERIKQLENVKKHFLLAKAANDADPGIWHMLGQFNFKMSELGWVTKKLISSVASNAPTGSYEEAAECFEKAEQLKPGFYNQNKLFLARTYLALKQKDKAKEWFQKASEAEVRCEDDRVCREEALEALKKL